ncbi:ATP-binding protein, partial [Candidatus Bathyarchaeota archaeon]|nr:ATP-binding protein [Candidatus Bathyarchaeota archaeon]
SWFPNYSPEELVEIYGSFGGTPAYLELINEKTSVGTNIIETILRRNSPLYNEPEMLLMEELRTPQRYMDILSSLAQGYNKSSEIEGSTGINRENISTYLNTLENLDLIERITSITDPKAKRGLYVIKDPFFRFWFRFVRSNKRQLELGLEENIWHNIKEDFNQHLGQVFEDICREAIINMGKKGSLPLQMDRIGRWWIKDQEIDILCLEKKNKALAIEIKWSKIDKQDSDRLITKLSTKVNQIQGLNEVKLGIIAKEIIGKEKLRNEGFFIMDLKDLKQQNTI